MWVHALLVSVLSHAGAQIQAAETPPGIRDHVNLYFATEVQKVYRLLEVCPVWSGVPKDDLATRNNILTVMWEIGKREECTIRSAVSEYLGDLPDPYDPEAWPVSGETSTRCMKVLLLNKFVFDVPDIPRPRVGRGFLTNDADGGNPIWPLSVSESGELSLTGSYMFWFGSPSYLGVLDAFDWCAANYGRRELRVETHYFPKGSVETRFFVKGSTVPGNG